MLEQLRKNSQSGIIYFLFAIIIVVFIFTFNTSGPGGGCTGGDEWPAAVVNGETIYLSDVELGMRLSANPPANPLDSFGSAIYQGTRFARLGLSRPDLPTPYTPADTFTRPSAGGQPLKAAKVANDLVESVLVSQEATAMGLRVTDQELAAAVKEWMVAEQGEFTSEIYSNTIRYGLGTTRQKFEGLLSRELLRRKLVQVVANQGVVDPAAVDYYSALLNSTVTLRYAKIDAATVESSVSVNAGEAAAYAKANPEKIKEAYTARQAEFNQDKKVLLSGIFKKAPFPAQIENEADPAKKAELTASRAAAKAALDAIAAELNADAKAKAEAAATQSAAAAAARAAATAENGEPAALVAAPVVPDTDLFKAKASTESEDATKTNGGAFAAPLTKASLARYPYGENLAEAAFNLEAGATSEVIEVNRGFWILRSESTVAAFSKTEAEVANELATTLIQKEKSPGVIASTAAAFLAAAKKAPKTDLTELAKGFQGATVSVAETLPLARLRQLGDNKGWKQIGGLGCAPELVKGAFALNADAPLADEVFSVFGGADCSEDTGTRVVAQFVSNSSATDEESAAQKSQVRSQLEAFNQVETYRAWYQGLEAKSDITLTGDFEQYLRREEAAIAAASAIPQL